jgi:hypothetical protein
MQVTTSTLPVTVASGRFDHADGGSISSSPDSREDPRPADNSKSQTSQLYVQRKDVIRHCASPHGLTPRGPRAPRASSHAFARPHVPGVSSPLPSCLPPPRRAPRVAQAEQQEGGRGRRRTTTRASASRVGAAALPVAAAVVDDLEEVLQPVFAHLEAVHHLRPREARRGSGRGARGWDRGAGRSEGLGA